MRKRDILATAAADLLPFGWGAGRAQLPNPCHQACWCHPRWRHHVVGKSPLGKPSAEAALGSGVGGSAPGGTAGVGDEPPGMPS